MQVHDDTGEATLGLWGTAASSPTAGPVLDLSNPGTKVAREAWKPGETVLLIQAPGWKLRRTVGSAVPAQHISTLTDVLLDVPQPDLGHNYRRRSRNPRRRLAPALGSPAQNARSHQSSIPRGRIRRRAARSYRSDSLPVYHCRFRRVHPLRTRGDVSRIPQLIDHGVQTS